MSPEKMKEVNLTREGDRLHYGDTVVKGCSLPGKRRDNSQFSRSFEET